MILLVYFLFFSEEYGRNEPYTTYQYNLELFRETKRYLMYREQIGMVYFAINLLGNVVVFMPFGFLVPILYKFDWRKIIVSGILFGAITEIIQAGVEAFVGVNMHRIDINDVIANFSGVVIGYAGYCLLRILLEKIFQNGNVKIECEKYLSDFCFLERYY